MGTSIFGSLVDAVRADQQLLRMMSIYKNARLSETTDEVLYEAVLCRTMVIINTFFLGVSYNCQQLIRLWHLVEPWPFSHDT
jgi:hypothetical protein